MELVFTGFGWQGLHAAAALQIRLAQALITRTRRAGSLAVDISGQPFEERSLEILRTIENLANFHGISPRLPTILQMEQFSTVPP